MHGTCNPVLAHTVAAFGEGGAISRLVRNYRINPQQVDYARAVARMVGAPDPAPGQGGRIGLLEGSTGIGKSLGYLIPLCLNAALTENSERAIVSTHTNFLARQLLDIDGPVAIAAAREITGRNVTIARRVGRRNFVDQDRIQDLRDVLHATGRDDNIAAAQELDCWLDAACRTFADAAAEGLTIPAGLTEADICLLPSSSESASAAFNGHLAAGRDADILVTNHALSLINARTWFRVLDAPQNPARLAVFDEADTLPGVAGSMAETRLPVSTLKSLVDDLPDNEISRKAVRSVETLGTVIMNNLAHHRFVLLEHGDAIGLAVAASAQDCAQAIRAALPLADQILAESLLEAALDIEEWLQSLSRRDWRVPAISASPVRARPALSVITTEPARILARLWRCPDGRQPYLRAQVFTSGTLASPSRVSTANFSDIMHELGIDPSRDAYESANSGTFSPPKFGSMKFVLADRNVPRPTVLPAAVEGDDDQERPETATDPRWLAYAARGVREAHERGGRVLVLCTSYGDTAALAALLPGCLEHKRGTRLAPHIEAFEAIPDAILVTPAAWSGVSLPGIVKHVVIPRIPFAPPDPERTALLVKAIARRGGTEQNALGIMHARNAAEARRRLRQGLGRGIRAFDDACTVWILDPRFPLPEAILRDLARGVGLGLAKRHKSLISVIPERFRLGARPSFDAAEILPMEVKTAR